MSCERAVPVIACHDGCRRDGHLVQGRLVLDGSPEGVVCFAGDLSEEEQKTVWATNYAPAAALFSRNAPVTAWKSKPTWYIVANNDRTAQPDLQRFLAKRMGATIHAVDSSHVPMLSHPGLVIDVIRAAAKPFKDHPLRRETRRRLCEKSLSNLKNPRRKP